MKKAVLSVALFVLVITTAGAGVWLTHYFLESREQQELFSQLRDETAVEPEISRKSSTPKDNLVDRWFEFLKPEVMATPVPNQGTENEETPVTPVADEKPLADAEPVRHDAEMLADRNEDCIGWVTVLGTGIDYPVMWTPQEPQKYLKRSFQGENSSYGVPFLDGRCPPESGNLILYGHNMFDGSMFTPLIYFDSGDLGRLVRLEIGGELREYEIIAVAHTTAKSPIYHYTEVDSIYGVAAFLAAVKSECPGMASLSPQEGMEFVTLSTCEVSREDGRVLVIGRRVQ